MALRIFFLVLILVFSACCCAGCGGVTVDARDVLRSSSTIVQVNSYFGPGKTIVLQDDNSVNSWFKSYYSHECNTECTSTTFNPNGTVKEWGDCKTICEDIYHYCSIEVINDPDGLVLYFDIEGDICSELVI